MKVELEHLVKRFGGENVIDDVSFVRPAAHV